MSGGLLPFHLSNINQKPAYSNMIFSKTFKYLFNHPSTYHQLSNCEKKYINGSRDIHSPHSKQIIGSFSNSIIHYWPNVYWNVILICHKSTYSNLIFNIDCENKASWGICTSWPSPVWQWYIDDDSYSHRAHKAFSMQQVAVFLFMRKQPYYMAAFTLTKARGVWWHWVCKARPKNTLTLSCL